MMKNNVFLCLSLHMSQTGDERDREMTYETMTLKLYF